MKNKKFWNWVKNDAGESDVTDTPSTRTLYLNGVIAEESWYGDEITPQVFKDELESDNGDIEVWINSIGGDVYAATQIYNMLKTYNGKVTVKIDSLAASAASVIAMAGDVVLMSPLSLLFIHNPLTVATGNADDMQKAIDMLDEVKESIINAYELKSGLSRAKISHMMDCETWLSAKKAVELGFADSIMFSDNDADTDDSYEFSQREVSNRLMQKAIDMLDEVKESIINAYELKSGLSRAKISHMMDCETWLSAKKAVELGFADSIMFSDNDADTDDSYEFSQREVSNRLMNQLIKKNTPTAGVKISDLQTRLNLLK